MKTIIKLFTTILISFFLDFQTTTAQCHLDDWTALKALYESTDGDNWDNNADWQQILGNTPSSNCDLSLLYGVYLDEQGRVGRLPLHSNKLIGSIPPELGNLTNLVYLHLANNQLNGNIPPELGNLRNLTRLALFNNQLSGSIPPELGNLSNLRQFELGNNKLTGSIPPELGNLANLLELLLLNNQLSGSIPPELGNLRNLDGLLLYKNHLNGSIPSELGNLSNLTNFQLWSNQLIGDIPSELGNLRNLRQLLLFNNQLIGRIPPELGNLSNLYWLEIYNNDLSGCYNDNLAILCIQLNHFYFEGDSDISVGNNFDANWEDFCYNRAGICDETDVYPGDLNHDGIVNNQDISLSGLHHYTTGSARASAHQNTNWSAHPSTDWGIVNNQNKDLKHHDCNGDGLIDENDEQAVRDNMGKKWSEPEPVDSPEESDYQVMLHPIEQIYDGNLVMNVALERRIDGELNLQGGHFTIDYSDIDGIFSYVDLAFLPISWIGTPNNNLWYESTHFPTEKKIEVGFTRTNASDAYGSGVIGQLILEYDNSLARQAGATNNSYQFQVNTIGIHNSNTQFTPVENQVLQVNLNSICQPNWTIDEDMPFQNMYKSSGAITTNGFVIIGDEQEVVYQANSIILNSGFAVKAGADFEITVGACE